MSYCIRDLRSYYHSKTPFFIPTNQEGNSGARRARPGKQHSESNGNDRSPAAENCHPGPAAPRAPAAAGESSSDMSRSSSTDNCFSTNKDQASSSTKSFEEEDELPCPASSLPHSGNVGTSASIAETQADASRKKGRPKKGATSANIERNGINSSIAGLESLHETTLAYLAGKLATRFPILSYSKYRPP